MVGGTVSVLPPLGFAGVCPFAGSTYHDDDDDDGDEDDDDDDDHH